MVAATSRKDALRFGAPVYNTGRPCKRGHFSDRYTSRGDCCECARARAAGRYSDQKTEILSSAKERYRKDPKKYIRKQQARREEDPERAKRERREEYERNREAYISKAAKWAREHPERVREFIDNWRRNNPDRANQTTVRRRMRLKQRIPAWLSLEDIAAIQACYEKARKLTEATGVEHQVDHVIPIMGLKVSGLHVPGNLQVLTATENRSKSNNHV